MRFVFAMSLEQFQSHLVSAQLTSHRGFIVEFQARPPLIIVDNKPLTIIDVEGGTISPQYAWEATIAPDVRRLVQALKIALVMSMEGVAQERLLQEFAIFGKCMKLRFRGQSSELI